MKIVLETSKDRNAPRPIVSAIETERPVDLHIGALMELLDAVSRVEHAFDRLASHAERRSPQVRDNAPVTRDMVRAMIRSANRARR